jgi:hypothetical protein
MKTVNIDFRVVLTLEAAGYENHITTTVAQNN